MAIFSLLGKQRLGAKSRKLRGKNHIPAQGPPIQKIKEKKVPIFGIWDHWAETWPFCHFYENNGKWLFQAKNAKFLSFIFKRFNFN